MIKKCDKSLEKVLTFLKHRRIIMKLSQVRQQVSEKSPLRIKVFLKKFKKSLTLKKQDAKI